MRPFDYSSVGTVEEALDALASSAGTARLLAGGTDLLTLMKGDIVAPQKLVDIKRAKGLSKEIEDSEQGLVIGALVPIAALEEHPTIAGRYTALSQAAKVAATPQLRHMATTGGNLLQRPRCWYFRNSLVDCWLKGGETCPARDGQNQLHALFGDGPCYAVHPSDLAPALLALSAEARLFGPTGERTVSLEQFFELPEDDRRTETTLAGDEIIQSIRVPMPLEGTRSVYLKAMERKAWSFALTGVAVAVRVGSASGVIEQVRLVMSGVAPIPWRAEQAEQVLLGSTPGEEIFDLAAEAALNDAEPLRFNAYKIPLEKALIRRALAQATGANE